MRVFRATSPMPPPPSGALKLLSANSPSSRADRPVTNPPSSFRVDTCTGRVDTSDQRVDTSGWRVNTSRQKLNTSGRKVNTSGQKTEHLAKSTVNTSADQGTPRNPTHPSAQSPFGTPPPTPPSPPALPSVIIWCTIIGHAHIPPRGASRSHGPRPPALPPALPADCPHPSDPHTPPRPRPVAPEPTDHHPPARPPSHPAVNPLSAPPRRHPARLAPPVPRPENSRIGPKKSAKTVSRQPAPSGGGLARDSSPFIPHRAMRPSSPHPSRARRSS